MISDWDEICTNKTRNEEKDEVNIFRKALFSKISEPFVNLQAFCARNSTEIRLDDIRFNEF